MLISENLHKKSSKISIETRSTLASLLLKGQATKHTTIKWSIGDFQLISLPQMLVHRTKENKVFWEFDVTIMQNLSHNLL